MSSRASIINALQSIIDNANATTGRSDTDVTSAANRLISGYGGGGGASGVTEADIVGTDSEYLPFSCDSAPDIVAISANGWSLEDAIPGAVGFVLVKGAALGIQRYDPNTSKYVRANTTGIDPDTYPYGYASGNGIGEGSYADGVFTAKLRGPNANYYWGSSYTYHCVAITL